ncbi:MAG: amino acid ABC transporter permease [Egibacteraceae bacterium]
MGERLDDVRRLFFNWEVMTATFPELLREGLPNTLVVSFGAISIGIVAGMIVALMGISHRWWLKAPAKVYIDIFRGLPAVLTIVLVGLGLPAAGIRPWGREARIAAAIALGAIATAYTAEIFRAGIQSIDKGQMEASRSVGMTYLQAMWLVIIPQAVRRVFPPLTNEAIAIIKDSSLIFVIGLSIGQRDLFRVGQNLAQQTGNYSAVTAAALYYLAITIPLTYLVNWLDNRLREGPKEALPADELPTTAEPGR